MWTARPNPSLLCGIRRGGKGAIATPPSPQGKAYLGRTVRRRINFAGIRSNSSLTSSPMRCPSTPQWGQVWLFSSSRFHSVRLMEAVSGDGIGEDLPKVAHQRIEVDVFHRHGKGRIAILARPSLCRSDPLPIGGLVEGTAKTIAFDKRLHQRDPMAILRLPIGRKPPQHTAQNPAAQSLNAHPGQNQKPLVVG